jgi:hypothetical protein
MSGRDREKDNETKQEVNKIKEKANLAGPATRPILDYGP